MQVKYDKDKNQFVIDCPFHMNQMVQALPDRKWNKSRKAWLAPALKRNILFMKNNYRDEFFEPDALEVVKTYKEEKPKTIGFPSWYPFKSEPMLHQRKGLDLAWGNTEFAFLFEQGLGKTKTTIDWASALRMDGQIDGVVIICPSSIKLVWEKELVKHCPIDYQVMPMQAGKGAKVKKWIEQPHEFPWLVFGIESFSQGNAIEMAEYFVKTRRCFAAIDESTTIKNFSAKRTQRCFDLARESKFRNIDTGTPVTQGIEDLYSQFNFLDPDILGFQSYYSFRNHYCIMGGFEQRQVVGYMNTEELVESIAPYSLRVTKDEALDLPPKVHQPRYVELSKEQRTIYDPLKKDLIAKVLDEDHEISVDMILEQQMRLQQIVGGFYSVENEDTGEYDVFPVKGKNPKIEDLKQVMSEIDGKLIVFARFRPEISLITDELELAGYKVVQFHGDCSDEEKVQAVDALQEGNADVFVASYAAARGLTLTASTFTYYYSNSFSLEDRLQSEDRNHRMGTTSKVTYIDSIANNTVDIRIQEVIANKRLTADYVSDGIKAGRKALAAQLEESL